MTCQQVASGYKCDKNQLITFSSPYDVKNPLVTHTWTIDGVQESTASRFQKTYAAPGFHTVVHSGTNACAGTCSQSVQLEIVDVITPPPSGVTAAPVGVSPLVVAAVVVLGILGIVMMKKK